MALALTAITLAAITNARCVKVDKVRFHTSRHRLTSYAVEREAKDELEKAKSTFNDEKATHQPTAKLEKWLRDINKARAERYKQFD